MNRIREIRIDELYGQFSHSIILNLDERITIIHGPNGVGKTSILRIINAVFSPQKDSVLFKIPFESVYIAFEDGTKLRIEKKLSKTDKNPTLFYQLEPTGAKPLSFEWKNIGRKTPSYMQYKMIQQQLTFPEFPQNEIEKDTDLMRNYFMHFHSKRIEDARAAYKKEIGKIYGLANVHMIEAQRLIKVNGKDSRDEQKIEHVVLTYSNELKNHILNKLSEYASISQKLDSSFPTRLLAPKKKDCLNDEAIREKLIAIDKKNAQFVEAGILDKNSCAEIPIVSEIDTKSLEVLSVYIQDVEQKQGVFDELVEKIEVFTTIINRRLLYTKLMISKDKGFLFYPKKSNNMSADGISPTDLSSGEQHEIVLIYEMLFKIPPNALVIIDEPELSLHVAWQKQFLNDLQEILKQNSFDVLIATHSPQIIHNRWDLTHELGEVDHA